MSKNLKELTYPMINPRIESGASLGYSAIKNLSFGLGLWMNAR